MSTRTEPSLRLFFALPLPGALVRRLATWRDELAIAGRPVAPGDLHLTLTFLGNQPHSNLELLMRIAAELRGRPFRLSLDQLSCWRGGLLHLTPRQVPDELVTLQQRLQQALLMAGLPADTRPYRPHLTLARHSRLPVQAEPCAFAWQVKRFALLASQQEATGNRYHTLGEWFLRP